MSKGEGEKNKSDTENGYDMMECVFHYNKDSDEHFDEFNRKRIQIFMKSISSLDIQELKSLKERLQGINMN